MPLRRNQIIGSVVASLVIGYLVLTVSSVIWLGVTLKHKAWAQLSAPAQWTARLLWPMSQLTFGKWRELEVVRTGAELIGTTTPLISTTREYIQVLWPDSASWSDRQAKAQLWRQQLEVWVPQTTQWLQLAKTSLWWRLVPRAQRDLPLDQWLTDAWQATQFLSTGQKTLIIVWQNSQELRATGGFMGSYAKLDLTEGLITNLEIQDIYEPDGQFKGYIPAPPGVTEYLSSGHGLRLPDSNWWPDFPQSAQTVLSYFAFGKEQRVAGLVVVNLEVAEDLLRVLGPVELADYQVTVTADNFATVARADRSKFFPGSQQKAHFLSLLFNQLKFRTTQLTPSQAFELVHLWTRRAAAKDLQLYSPNAATQALAVKYGLAGQTSLQPIVFGQSATASATLTPDPLYLELVESNVGINKANAKITREVTAQILANQLQLQVTYTNHHPLSKVPTALAQPSLLPDRPELTNGLGYVNYQRLIVSPYLKVASIEVDDQPLKQWHEDSVTWSGLNLKQIGFILTVPEASKRHLTVVLEPNSTAPVKNLLTLPGLTIQKQAGLPPTPYQLFWANQRQNFVLETDMSLKF